MLLFGANQQNDFSCSLFQPIKLNVLSTVASETCNAISFEVRFVAIKLPYQPYIHHGCQFQCFQALWGGGGRETHYSRPIFYF